MFQRSLLHWILNSQKLRLTTRVDFVNWNKNEHRQKNYQSLTIIKMGIEKLKTKKKL